MTTNQAGYDPFKTLATNSGGYDKGKIYKASTDPRGHYEKASVKIPQGTLAKINEVIRGFEDFRNYQDFVRNAIVHMLHEYGSRAGDQEILDHVDLLAASEGFQRLEDDMDHNKGFADKVKAVLDKAMASRDQEALRRAVGMAEMDVMNLKEPYRGQVLEHVERTKREME